MMTNFKRFMKNRYGTDVLNKRILQIVILIAVVNQFFIHSKGVTGVWLFLILIVYLRTFSKNIERRYRELILYQGIVEKARTWFRR